MTGHADDRFVGHFDMLGMSALTRRNPDLAWQKLSELSQARGKRLQLGIERLDTKELIADQVRSFIFSDTLIAYSKGETENDALALLLLTTEVFTLALHHCIPLRGGIAHGRFNFNLALNLFSGPALVDAHELGETSQWLGVVIDDKTASTLKNTPIRAQGGKDAIVQWEVPVKTGSVTRNVVNWAETHRHNYVGPLPLTAEIFYSPMASLFGPWEDLPRGIQMKYENTVTFFNAHYTRSAAQHAS